MHVSLVDRILAVEPLREVRAVKNLSFREDYLRDHFPGFPLMPGALQLEAMIQSAQWLLRASHDFPAADFVTSVVSNTRYAKYVVPGDQLLLTVSLVKQVDGAWRFRGQGEVEGARTAQAQFEIVRYDAAWKDLSPDATRRMQEELRSTYARLTQIPAMFAAPPAPEAATHA